jgi:cytochrome c oxidase assembly factor CtaG
VRPLLAFHLHWLAVTCVVVAVVVERALVATKRERRVTLSALLTLLVVVVWPVGDVAATVSLTVATLQRLVIMLLVAPLLLLATPTQLLVRLTRPRVIDDVVQFFSHPGVAMAFVTLVGTATLTTPVVDWGASSSLARGLVLVAVLAAGVVLWIPGLAMMPGTRRLSPVARAGYIFASALVVTSLSFVWIFSRHSLYPSLHHQYALLHMTPLFDQQLAGFVAKFACYIPMWAVAFTIFARADETNTTEESPLHWADVERELLRVDRQRERQQRRESRE